MDHHKYPLILQYPGLFSSVVKVMENMYYYANHLPAEFLLKAADDSIGSFEAM